MTTGPATVDATTGDTITAPAVRRCAYSQCGQPLPNREGRGPKLRYCRDRRWEPENKTCREMAAAERGARRAAGDPAPLAALAALAEHIEEAGAPLAELYAQIQDALDDAATAALRAAQQAHQDAAEQAERAEQALTLANRAADGQRQAEAARDQALARTQEAERRATEARRTADEQVAAAAQQVTAATERLAAAERERGQAQATGAAAVNRATEEIRRREDAERGTAAALAECRDLRILLDTARSEVVELRQLLTQATRRAEQAETGHAHLVEQADRLRDQVGLATSQRDDADRLAREAEAEADRLARELVSARAASSAATAAEQAATARAQRAETQVDQLLAVLPRRLEAGGQNGPQEATRAEPGLRPAPEGIVDPLTAG